jgi:hypothetical protein
MEISLAIIIEGIVCFILGGITGYSIHKLKVDMEAEKKRILGQQ